VQLCRQIRRRRDRRPVQLLASRPSAAASRLVSTVDSSCNLSALMTSARAITLIMTGGIRLESLSTRRADLPP
jgi:hypothetical protein